MFLIRLSSASNWTKIENLEKILYYYMYQCSNISNACNLSARCVKIKLSMHEPNMC